MSTTALVFVTEKYNKNSIAALCGALERDLRFADLHICFPDGRNTPAHLKRLLPEYEQVVVAFSFCTPNLIEIAGILADLQRSLGEAEKARLRVLAGGPHPSGDYRETLRLGFECVVVGEGEASFPELLERIVASRDYRDVRGIAYLEGGLPKYTGNRPRAPLEDSLPFSPRYRRFGPIEITRGCPWACRYCQTPFLHGGSMRHRSVENIATYAEIARSHGLRDLRFVTPDAFAFGSDGRRPNHDLLEELLIAVQDIYGREHIYLGSFPSEVRPDMVTKEAVDLIIHHAANDNLVIGAQSGSQKMLDHMHRGHSVEDIYRAVDVVTLAGLTANVDIIFGLPGETEHDVKLTLKMMDDLTSLGARIHSHTFIPLAGTPLANAPPGTVGRQTRTVLGRLASRGKQFGQWEQQERIGRAVTSFKKKMQ